MADYTVKRIDELEAVFGGGFKRARAELGVTSFGMQIIDMPPNNDRHPEHDHTHDGQEEVYLVLRGSADLDIEGERVPLDRETLIRVAPDTKRKLLPGDEGVRVLVLGGKPGAPYQAPDVTQLGAPDPLASS
jgi:mannose-6-phosphate isomerase-like protein (cupin superfamily)